MQHANQLDGESKLKVRLFVQGFAPNGAEAIPASIHDRLKRLEAAGAIDDCEVEVWGRKVCRRIGDDRPTIGGDALDRIDEFRAWADRTGASLDRCFDESEVHSELTGENRTEVRLPIACLAVYGGEDLLGVYPHAEAGEERTVADGLDRLADGDRGGQPNGNDYDDQPNGTNRDDHSNGADRGGQSTRTDHSTGTDHSTRTDRDDHSNRRPETIRH